MPQSSPPARSSLLMAAGASAKANCRAQNRRCQSHDEVSPFPLAARDQSELPPVQSPKVFASLPLRAFALIPMPPSTTFIGLDVGGTNIKCVAFNAKGETIAEETLPT